MACMDVEIKVQPIVLESEEVCVVRQDLSVCFALEPFAEHLQSTQLRVNGIDVVLRKLYEDIDGSTVCYAAHTDVSIGTITGLTNLLQVSCTCLEYI